MKTPQNPLPIFVNRRYVVKVVPLLRVPVTAPRIYPKYMYTPTSLTIEPN